MIWREEERSRIKAVLMDNLRGLLGIRRMDRVPIAQNGELCVVVKGVDERIDECSMVWPYRKNEEHDFEKGVCGRVRGYSFSKSTEEEVG